MERRIEKFLVQNLFVCLKVVDSYYPAADNEACVADDWDYINSKCSDKMREGYLLDIDADCGANQQLCFDFESNNLAINNPITK